MPAIPAITAATGIIGGIGSINSANNAANMDARDQQLTENQFQYNTETDFQDLLRKIASGNKYWDEGSQYNVLGYNDAKNQANMELGASYDDEATSVMNNTRNALLSRGMFGQIPGAQNLLDTQSKLLIGKNRDIATRASDLVNSSKTANLGYKQLGLGTFGTYGQQATPIKNQYAMLPAAKKKTGFLGK